MLNVNVYENSQIIASLFLKKKMFVLLMSDAYHFSLSKLI